MTSLAIRVTSALAAISILIGLFYFFGLNGLRMAVLAIVLMGGRELVKLLFLPNDTFVDRAMFYLCSMLIYGLSVAYFDRSSVVYVCISIFYFSLNLWRHRSETNLGSISTFHAKSLLGFFYIGLLPVFADRLLMLSHGLVWFGALLAIVFTGDSMAYIFGVSWGKHKIMPAISPKKSTEGAVGGLVGSAAAAIAVSFFLPHIPIYVFVVLALIIGMIGQFGDFFESLLKRVADIKDSGSIMPGHGGVLDRIDGILFAAPFVYLTASLFDVLT